MTSLRRRRQGSNPRVRRSIHAPASGPTVSATAMPTADDTGIGVNTFTRKPPTAMAGQMRGPNSRIAPSAMPAAGQTGETFPLV